MCGPAAKGTPNSCQCMATHIDGWKIDSTATRGRRMASTSVVSPRKGHLFVGNLWTVLVLACAPVARNPVRQGLTGRTVEGMEARPVNTDNWFQREPRQARLQHSHGWSTNPETCAPQITTSASWCRGSWTVDQRHTSWSSWRRLGARCTKWRSTSCSRQS